MALETLTPEQRQAMEAQARVRINSGLEELNKAEAALRHAVAARDAAGADEAARRLREGLNEVSGGTVTLRALADGKPPQQIAQDWFKTQLNLMPPASPQRQGSFGFSWFHIITMSLVAAFAAGMLIIYVLRVRRANMLVNRLAVATTPSLQSPTIALVSPPAFSKDLSKRDEEAATAPLVTKASGRAEQPASQAQAAHAVTRAKATQPWKGKLQVAAIFPETPNVKTFRLRDPQGRPVPFSFLPGQFLTYAAEIDGKIARRSYTIASSAAQTAYVETTIKREDFGVFSDHMHDKIKVGDLIDVTGPFGGFTFQGSESESIVLIGGGVGITPLMSAIRYLTDIAWPREIFLVYGARTSADFIFRDELEYLQRHHANLHVAATMVRAAGTAWVGPEGPITTEFLAQVVPDIAHRRVHLCGPPGMMTAMRTCLAKLGVPDAQVKTEAFGPARGAVPAPSAPVTAGGQAPMARGPDAVVASTSTNAVIGPATAAIRFTRSNKTEPLPPDQTVLEVAEAAGVPIDYACRAGICGTCKVKLLEGKVTMEVEDALTAEDKANRIILACQAKSVGNLAVEA
jgi:ferredoxin-NADP reductase